MNGPPTVNDDSTTGCYAGQRWIDNSTPTALVEYVCRSAAPGAAVWQLILGADGKVPGGLLPTVASQTELSAILTAMLGLYRTIRDAASSHLAGKVAGNYALGCGDPTALTGVGALDPQALIHINPAEYPTINGLTPRLRVKALLQTNDVAPGGNYTVGLFPVTHSGVTGAAGLLSNTLGAMVAGSGASPFQSRSLEATRSSVRITPSTMSST